MEISKFNFYLKFEHSDLYDALYKNNNNINNKNNIEKILENNNKQDLIENKIITKDNFEKQLKEFIIDNKNKNLNLNAFIKYGNWLIRDKTIKDFNIKEYTLQNLYYKLLHNLFPNNSDEIFKYAKTLSNGEDFIRSIINTYFYINNNKKNKS